MGGIETRGGSADLGGQVIEELGERPEPAGQRIEDDGGGVSAAHLERLTESFYRADPSRARITGGRGLGLAIAQRIVHLHGGSLELEDPPDGGALFRITLPLEA